MDKINNIPKRGLWSESTSKIDQNFKVFEDVFNKIEDDAQKCKGLFPSLSSLKTEFPNPAVGSWAYVGSSLPALIYIYRSPSGWTSTGKSGGDNLDPSIYANSIAIESAEDLYSIKDGWLGGYNKGNWITVTKYKLKLNSSATEYQIRLSSLLYGENGQLLEQTLTDPYLYVFKKGSFVSLTLLSSDGVSKTYTENILSWTIDKTFYKRVISGHIEDRLPVVGDTLRATLKFKDPTDSDIKVKGLTFKFVL